MQQWAISSQDFFESKVQRLSQMGVHSSEWKWRTSQRDEDIVFSLAKVKAVHKRTD